VETLVVSIEKLGEDQDEKRILCHLNVEIPVISNLLEDTHTKPSLATSLVVIAEEVGTDEVRVSADEILVRNPEDRVTVTFVVYLVLDLSGPLLGTISSPSSLPDTLADITLGIEELDWALTGLKGAGV
jgi:hypothetical protein